jgi:putative Mg2+ transporter-C (MgtC) family protein
VQESLATILHTLLAFIEAFALGTAIGLERQLRQRAAGLRTTVLVAVGAAAFADLGQHLLGAQGATQLIAYIISGIGFLGAGVIMREGINVHGLNTAATLWCSAMIGTLCGFGMWQSGGVAASLVLGANIALRPLANRLNERVQSGNEVESHYTLTVLCDAAAAPAVRSALLQAMVKSHLPPHQLLSAAADAQTSISVHADTAHVMDDAVEKLLAAMAQDANVRSTSWQVVRAAPEA